ncbi:N4-gp56 family major capsid protein [Clostridium sp. LP20]|uniref:N4-gp56 family major capsid protein n=1 Tax=Clostridium sp. LP20 TaxID=3418665 RepID=UPI003EE5C90A
MAINYAKKYSDKVVERFRKESFTETGLNKDYEWKGVKTVAVYSIPTVGMNDYARTGDNRYGTPTELQDTVQEMSVSKDRSFTFTIDRGNQTEQMGVKESGKALRRQIDEVVTPEIDKYRLATWAAKTGIQTNATKEVLSAANAYEKFLEAQEKLDDESVPEKGRICYATPKFLKFLKLSDNFIKASDIAQNMLIKGQVGEVDGVAIKKAPTRYFPANVGFELIHPSVSCSPMKLADYKTHDNPPGINGWLVEGRVIYDCFVLDELVKAIYVYKEA